MNTVKKHRNLLKKLYVKTALA